MALRNTIMVVDDDPLMIALLTEKLEGAGYHVTSASDAGEAINQAMALRPRLIISDMQMPLWGTGADVLASIRGNPILKDAPVVFVTGSVYDRVKETYPTLFQDTKVRVLGKPVDWLALERAIFELTGELRPLQKRAGT